MCLSVVLTSYSPGFIAQLSLEPPACTSDLFKDLSPDFIPIVGETECERTGIYKWSGRDLCLKSQASMWNWPFPYGRALATISPQ